MSWPCVAEPQSVLPKQNQTFRSLAQVMPSPDVSIYVPLPQQEIKGDALCIRITQDEYLKGIEAENEFTW